MAFFPDILTQGFALLPLAIYAGLGLLAAVAYLVAVD